MKFVVEVYTSNYPQTTRLDGPFEDSEEAGNYARKMTTLWGLALVRTLHEPD